MSTLLALPSRAAERWLIGIDRFPWAALYRVALGYLLAWVSVRWSAPDPPGWSVLAWLLGTLVALRVVPVLVRRIVPFSPEANAIWAERRMLAKRYDSYQWQKLLWFGIGLLVYGLVASRFDRALTVTTALSVAGGGVGLVLWWRNAVVRRSELESFRAVH